MYTSSQIHISHTFELFYHQKYRKMHKTIWSPERVSADVIEAPPRRRESDQGPDWRNPSELLQACKDRKIPRKVFLDIIFSLPKSISDHGNAVKVFEELEKTGTPLDTITEIMEFFWAKEIVMGGDDGQNKGNILHDFHKEKEKEVDQERVDLLMKRLENKKWKNLDSVDKTNVSKDAVIILRFSRKKREGDTTLTISFEIALLVEYIFSSTMMCLVYINNPEQPENPILKNINMRLPIWPEGDRQFENLVEKIGNDIGEERRNILSERYLREIVLIPGYWIGVKALWAGIREGVGNVLWK